MKRFKFRLEKLLEYRRNIKEDRKRELLLKNHQLREAEDKLAALERARDETRAGGRGVMGAELFLLTDAYRTRIMAEIEQQRIVIEDCRKAAQEAQAKYVEAAREEKALSLLREKRLREYQEYVQKEDEKFLDELSTQKGNTLYEEEPYE
jgi:flagellar FliJ protein